MSSQEQAFVACFVFKPTHYERHYLANPKARTYSTAISRDKAKAARFSTREAAREAMEKKLEAWDRGRANGYYYTTIVEQAN